MIREAAEGFAVVTLGLVAHHGVVGRADPAPATPLRHAGQELVRPDLGELVVEDLKHEVDSANLNDPDLLRLT